MQKFIACLLVVALLGMISPPLFAQQNQNPTPDNPFDDIRVRLLPAQQNQNAQKSNPQIEALKKRVSEMEKKLQAVENAKNLF